MDATRASGTVDRRVQPEVDVAQDTVRRLDDTDRERGGRHRGWLFRRPTFGGAAVALLFWWWSLDPSMLPRTWTSQGA
jgi:uncharacterized membrane protein